MERWEEGRRCLPKNSWGVFAFFPDMVQTFLETAQRASERDQAGGRGEDRDEDRKQGSQERSNVGGSSLFEKGGRKKERCAGLERETLPPFRPRPRCAGKFNPLKNLKNNASPIEPGVTRLPLPPRTPINNFPSTTSSKELVVVVPGQAASSSAPGQAPSARRSDYRRGSQAWKPALRPSIHSSRPPSRSSSSPQISPQHHPNVGVFIGG